MKFISKIIDKKLRSFESLGEELQKHSIKSISDEGRGRLRKSVIANIVNKNQEALGFDTLVEKIKTIALELRPTSYFRVLLREKLITLVEFQAERKRQRRISVLRWITKPVVIRKFAATITVFAFVFTVLFSFGFDIDEVKASLFTRLDKVDGKVTVVRNDKEIKGREGLHIKANDIIRTGENSKAGIRFLDQSVSRLDEKGELKVVRLSVNPRKKTHTVVELVLNEGQLWNRVINLVDDEARFQVKAGKTVTTAKKKAAFNISVDASGPVKVAKVSAVKNKVDVVVATSSRKVVETTIVKGFAAEVHSNEIGAVATIAVEGVQSSKEEEWVSKNLAEDEEYIQEVKDEAQEQIKDQVQVSPDSPLYPVKELSEATKLALTFDGFKKQKKLISLAREKLSEAGLMIEKGNTKKAGALLMEFRAQIENAYMWIKEHEEADSEEAAVIEAQLEDILSSYKKQMVLILPDDPAYQVKEAVSETEILAVQDDDSIGQAKKQLSQASEKLLEAEDLVEVGDTEGATKKVEKYGEEISGIAEGAKSLPTQEKEEVVSAILDTKVNDLKTLESIVTKSPSIAKEDDKKDAQEEQEFSSSLDVLGSTDFSSIDPLAAPSKKIARELAEEVLKEAVSGVKMDGLTKMGEAVLDVQQEQPSVGVLQKLNTVEDVEVNGKKVVDVNLYANQMTIQSGGKFIFVKQPLKEDLGAPKLPQTQQQTPQ